MPQKSKNQKDQVDINVGRRIREARLASGLSQSKVAEALSMSFQQIQKYERGINRVAPSRLVIIAKMTGRNVDWFFSDTGAITNSKSPKRDDAIADLAASQHGQRLARAYLAIRSPQLRTAFLKLLEGSIG